MTLLAALLLCQVPAAEMDRLIQHLGHEWIEVREHAKREIVKVGIAALPSLRKVAETADAQMRADVESVIAWIDPDIYQLQELLRKNRPGDPKLDPNGQPWNVVTGTAGFRVHGITRGNDTVVRTMAWNYLTRPLNSLDAYGGIRFDVRAEDEAGTSLTIDRCGSCSPGVVLVRDHTGPSRIQLTGVQTWFSKYPFELPSPKNGETIEVAGMTLEVAWPRLVLKSKTGWDSQATQLLNPHFDYELLPNAKSVKPRQIIWRRCVSDGCGAGPEPTSWCECVGGPYPLQSKAESPNKQLIYSAEAKDVPLRDVAVIRVTLWKPIEIPFDFTVDVKPYTRR